LRDSIKDHVADIEKKYGISNMKAIIQFSVSDEFKDMLFEQYKVLRARDFGLPQNRERIYIVGFLDKNVMFRDFL
jgi:site-specific DNA-cytosine methylase